MTLLMTPSDSYYQISNSISKSLGELASNHLGVAQSSRSTHEFTSYILANLVQSDVDAVVAHQGNRDEVITLKGLGFDAHSRKMINVRANIQEFLATLGEGSVSVSSAVTISVPLAILALIIVLYRLTSLETIHLDSKLTAIVWALWEGGHLTPEKALKSDELITRVNRRLSDQFGSEMSNDEFESSLSFLSNIRCIRSRFVIFNRPDSQAWWVEESVEYRFDN